jgi:hypothetical protein
VPERRIDRRSVYEQAGVAEWTLANGLTVVYLHDPASEEYHARLQSPTGWASLPASMQSTFHEGGTAKWGVVEGRVEPSRRVATVRASTLASLVNSIEPLFSRPPDEPGAGAVASAFDRPAQFVLVMVGPAGREWVESVIAMGVATVRGRDSSFGPALDSAEPIASGGFVSEIDAGWDDVPPITILDRLLQGWGGRGDAARLDFDASTGTARLWIEPALTPAELLQLSSERAILAAREAAARAAASPHGRLLALATLYEVPGDFRPARAPLEALSLPSRIARTSPDRVADFLRRLAEAAVAPAPPLSQPE